MSPIKASTGTILISSFSAFLLFWIVRNLHFEHLFSKLFSPIFVGSLFICYTFHEVYWKRRFMPPGPIPWLIAGNMPQILSGGSDFDATFLRWSQHYGGVFTFWMGPIPMVMVSDVELLRRYFVRHGDAFSGRWQNFITHFFMDGHNGIVQIEGDKWREQRRFSLHVLRDFGLGRALMEEKIQHEVDALIAHLDHRIQENGGFELAIDVTKPIAICISNIINNILFGRTYAHDDPTIIQMNQLLDRQSALVVRPIMGLYLTLPFTINFPPFNRAWNQLLEIREKFWAFLEDHLQRHRSSFDPCVQPTDFTFAYMQEMHRRREETRDSMGHFSERQLKMLLLDLFFAGSETTVTTTKWGILNLILHPEVQEKCYQELAEKVGPREVELKDRISLTYLQATICEIQRVANILPINLLRTCEEEVELDGYRFPAGTMVLPQVSIALNNPAYFAEPKQFRPERFIDENANLRKYDAFLPFSIGKRQCLGESLAKAELFLVFANLIKHFKFAREEQQQTSPSTKRVYGLTVSPQPYRCVITRRKAAIF